MTPRPPVPVWRSILYVPGNVPKFIDKAHERGADCVLVDLEDSVQPAQKPEARAMLPETLKKVVRGGADVAVRINRPMRLAMADLEAAVRPGVAALFVTKTEGVQHLALLDEAVSELERERGLPVGGIGFAILPDCERVSAEIGYWMGEAVWGRGIATEALVAAHYRAEVRVFGEGSSVAVVPVRR